MAEGVPTNNQRGRRSGPCRLWGGLDKARHIVPTALLVRVQCFRKSLHKAVQGPSTIILWTSVEIWWYFVPRIFVKRNLSPSLLRWSSLQTKEGQRHTEFHLVGFENSQTPSTTTVWPSDHREDYRSCAWPLYSPVQTFPKALHSD